MGKHVDRPPPTAYLHQGQTRYGRKIILSTGRGCMSITPAEAYALALELTRLAGVADRDPADAPTRVVSLEQIRREYAAAVEDAEQGQPREEALS